MNIRIIFPAQVLNGLILTSCFMFSSYVLAQPPQGKDCSATDLLPKTIVACIEISDLGSALQTILTHPLRTKLEALPVYDAFMQSGAPKQMLFAVKTFEGSMQQPWEQAISTLSDRGVTVALDAAEGGAALLLHSSDAEALERLRSFIVAARQLQGGPAKQGDYRGFTADTINDNLKMVRMHDWLLLTNKSNLGKAIIDQYLDRGNESLATTEKYATALKELKSRQSENRVASAYLDIKTLRDSGAAKDIYKEKVDNFLAEVVLGGVLTNIRQTPFATATLDLDQNGLLLQVATPHNRDWETPREYFFGAPALAAAPSLLNVDKRLFALSAHRDLAQMWLRAGDLLSDRANEQLAVADTQLTTFFSGRDFGEDILGALESNIQIVGNAQNSEGLPQPAIKLPAFAMQFRMRNPEETQPELRRVFQAFVGFLNVTGAMNGQPQLDLGMEKIDDAQLITATYVPARDQRESVSAPIQFNFSPTLAFVGERIILASTTSLARELVAIEGAVKNDTRPESNTASMMDMTMLQQILQANRSQLVAKSMLDKGHSKAAAEREIGLLLELVGFLRNVRINLDITDSQMILDAAVEVN